MDTENRSNYWPQIFLLVAAAANLVRFAEPLRSSRPTEPPPQERRTISDPNIEARLWQDPFEAVSLREARFQGSKIAETNGTVAPERNSLGNLVRQMRWFAKNDTYENQITVLAVMVPGNTYSEGVEQRLRARYAVLAGLIECGVRPEQSEFIGQLQVPWLRSGGLHPEFKGRTGQHPESDVSYAPLLRETKSESTEWLSVPYEWLTGRVPVAGADSKRLNSQAVLVLWLREEAFADYPKLRLAQFLGRLREDFYSAEYKYSIDPREDPLRLRILGPSQSSTLIRMLESTVDWPGWHFEKDTASSSSHAWAVAGHTVSEVLEGRGEGKDTQFFCATATAADEVLMIPPNWQSSSLPRQFVQDKFFADKMNFASTCATDRQLVQELLDELERRGIEAGAAHSPVAVLTEYDTFYGRVMAETFTNLVASRQSALGVVPKGEPVVLHYLRGVDGRVAGDVERKTEASDKKEGADAKRALLELPEGRSQLDYIPRLVQRLRAMHGRNGPKAIGILGSDVYDKLLLLQSLRHEFPEVIFFTTELDARLFHPRELGWSRNLLVASSYGLQLANQFQDKIPPFRESSQTALFAACMRAMDRFGIPAHLPQPRIFEIGRLEPVDLSVTASNLHPSRPGLQGGADASDWNRLVCGVILVMLLLISLSPISPTLRRWMAVLGILFGSLFLQKIQNKIEPPFNRENGVRYSLWAWLLLLVFAALILCIHYNHFSPFGEVFSLWNGVSIWPSEVIRLLGFYLSLAGLFYSWHLLNRSTRELANRYQLEVPAESSVASLSLGALCRAFWPCSAQRREASISRWAPEDGMTVSAHSVWKEYLRLGSLQNRLHRCVPPSVFYVLFGTLLVMAWGFPMVPYRGGNLVMIVDKVCLFLFIVAFSLLMFAVLDDTRLCSRMIKLLADKPTDWGKAQEHAAGIRAMSPEHVDDYLDIRFIAERTAAMGSLIYLPFGLLALMIISRGEAFDRWPWPPSLLVLFGLNSLFTLYSAISLKRAASRARALALRHLQIHLLKVMGSDAAQKDTQADQIRATMEEIRAVKQGAFAPLPLHPALGAALLPFGGAGLLALLEHLASI